VTMTYEAAGLKVEEFDNKLEAAYKLFETIMEYASETPIAPRNKLLYR